MNGGAYLLLEDGARFDGYACGGEGYAVGEVVFTTTMSGYQESFTDPSYAAQILVFTYPHIGNYGTDRKAYESPRPWARAAVMREARNARPGEGPGWLDWLQGEGIPALTGIDTRALVFHIREKGAMRGGVFPASMPEAEARELVLAEPPMVGRNLAAQVGVQEPVLLADEADLALHLEGKRPSSQRGGRPLVAVIDTGVKGSILRELLRRGVAIQLLPFGTSADQLLAYSPDLVLLANGPGDPAALAALVGEVEALVGRVPLFGICLGHQLLCRAAGLETYKLPFGHRGANHPVKDLDSGWIAITSQNHGFAAKLPTGEELLLVDERVEWESPFGRAGITHVNLYDRTVEGIELQEARAAAVQYHPEAGPGPHDSYYLFDRIVGLVEGG